MAKGPYVPLSVSYRENDRMLGVSLLAELLFVRALAFSKEKYQDGFVGDRQLRLLTGDMEQEGARGPDLALELVKVGLWHEVGDGWLIEGWTDWNTIDASRAGSLGNHRRWHVQRGMVDDSCDFCHSERMTSGAIAPDVAPESGGISGSSLAVQSSTTQENTHAAPPLARDHGFAEFWDVYPRRRGRKVGKERALERWSRFDLATRRLAFKAAKRYADACDAGDTYAKDAERFLTRDYWRDWLEEAAPTRPPGVPPDAVPDGAGGWIVPGVAS